MTIPVKPPHGGFGDILLIQADIITTIVNSTVVETTLTTLTVPAGYLAVGYGVRAVSAGDILNNIGADATCLFRVKLGATTILTTPAITLAASANRRKWRLAVDILAESGVLQRASGVLHISDAAAETFADTMKAVRNQLGWPSTDARGGAHLIGYGTAAETGANVLDIAITVTLSTANANLEVTHKIGTLEGLR